MGAEGADAAYPAGMRRGLLAVIATTALLTACGGGESETRATPDQESASPTTDACADVFEEARAITDGLGRGSTTRKIESLNTIADQAAADCPLDKANELEAAVERVEAADDQISLCLVDPNCGFGGENFGEFNDAVEELRRAVLAS